MDGYVSKPVDQSELRAEIARLMARAASTGTPETKDSGPAMDGSRGKMTGAVPPFALPAAAHDSQENLNSLFSTMDVPRKAAARTR
jgi:DNA-binding response OmpR family regulator